MSTPKRWTCRSQLVVMGAVLLSGVGQAGLPTSGTGTLGARVAAMSGTGLTGAECRRRMQALNTLLRSAGYRSVRTHTLEDGTLVARWYDIGRKATALAFSGQNSTANTFSAREYAGLLRWNEVIGIP